MLDSLVRISRRVVQERHQMSIQYSMVCVQRYLYESLAPMFHYPTITCVQVPSLFLLYCLLFTPFPIAPSSILRACGVYLEENSISMLFGSDNQDVYSLVRQQGFPLWVAKFHLRPMEPPQLC
jgi:hypothetical protein